MTEEDKINFINFLYPQALLSKHLFPKHSCCEVALESAWGKSKLFIEGKNPFGMKQGPHTTQFETMTIPTKEFIHGQWITVLDAVWVKFPTLQIAFNERMSLLQRLRKKYSNYDAALMAGTGETFIYWVSKTWSTDENRGEKVMSIYKKYEHIFKDFEIDTNAPSETLNPNSFWEYMLNKLNLKDVPNK